MKWTVVWKPDALNALAELWRESLDRKSFSAASILIDEMLSRTPLAYGESREHDSRVLIIPPFAVASRVSVDDCMVAVGRVWQSRHSN